MPLYEYQCQSCGERFEILQPIGATAEGVRCTRCNADTVERCLSSFACQGSSSSSSGSGGACGGGSGFT